MEKSSDGFYIAEKDFEQRGQGDLFGVKQSGDMSFKIANLKRDFNILTQANIDAKEFLDNKSYQDYDYYKNIIKEIDFLDWLSISFIILIKKCFVIFKYFKILPHKLPHRAFLVIKKVPKINKNESFRSLQGVLVDLFTLRFVREIRLLAWLVSC